jgi:predicted GIY-YIG superfamily endonuclease
MHPWFATFVDKLDPKFQALVAMKPVRYGDLPLHMPDRGIYLFSRGEEHFYVGRTNGMRRRLSGHCRPSSTHFSATFAFRMARQETGLLKATYKAKGSRSDLLRDERFKASFESAKGQLREMDLRYVEEADAVRQALLEIYVAVILKTPYNDFENH